MRPSSSLLERYILLPRRRWVPAAVILALLAAPLIAARVEGVTFAAGAWRPILVPPLVLAYILAVAPRLAKMEDAVMQTLRPLLLEDPRRFDQDQAEAQAKARRREPLAFGAGAVFTLVLSWGGELDNLTLTGAVMMIASLLVNGVLAVLIYGSADRSRGSGGLLRRPLRVDPLDVSAFDAVGRLSLALSLVFMGGITLSLVLTWVSADMLRMWQFWAVYAPLAAMPLVVFFVNMLPTHRLLAAARQRELRRVDRLIRESCASLILEAEQGPDAGSVAQRVNALAVYEARLLQARTWPYNTLMLRTVFASVLVPGGTVAGRLILEALQS